MTNTLIKRNATAIDAVKLVQATAWKERNSKAVLSLLQQLPYQPTLRWFENMFWLIDSITEYKYDDPGREQIKTPDRFCLIDKTGDCDDYSGLWLAVLNHVKVKGFPKIVDYEDDGFWDHIYVIVPLKDTDKYLVLDNVVGKYRRQFNVEVDYQDSKIFRPKSLSGLGRADDTNLEPFSMKVHAPYPFYDMKEFVKAISRTIKVITWGARGWSNWNNNALAFRVSARRHKGIVVIAPNGLDLFNVYLLNMQRKVKEVIENVYVEDVVDTIDRKIEFISQYKH